MARYKSQALISGVHTKKGKTKVTPYDLAKRWNIGLETAIRTLLKTTQRGLRTSPHSLLSQWYSTNDRMLRYRGLPVDLFTDTLETGIVSHRGINMPKLMPTGTHSARHTQWQGKVKHMRHYHSCLHKRGPKHSGNDGAREQVMGEFRHEVRQADCHVKQTEPYSTWQNAAEGTIRELKKELAET